MYINKNKKGECFGVNNFVIKRRNFIVDHTYISVLDLRMMRGSDVRRQNTSTNLLEYLKLLVSRGTHRAIHIFEF